MHLCLHSDFILKHHILNSLITIFDAVHWIAHFCLCFYREKNFLAVFYNADLNVTEFASLCKTILCNTKVDKTVGSYTYIFIVYMQIDMQNFSSRERELGQFYIQKPSFAVVMFTCNNRKYYSLAM